MATTQKQRENCKRYREHHKEECKLRAKELYQRVCKDPAKIEANQERCRKHYYANKEKYSEKWKARRIRLGEALKIKERRWNREARKRLKMRILLAYGAFCHCSHKGGYCGVAVPEFLCIDHIDPMRREPDEPKSSKLYEWLSKKGFPKTNFRVLCYNCNCSRRQGKCILSI